MNQPNGKEKKHHLLLVIGLATLLAAIVAGAFWFSATFSPPSVQRQAVEVTALQTHVLPVVEELRVTRYLDAWPNRGRSICWDRGDFTDDVSRAREEGEELFDDETKAAHERLTQAIRASGVPTERLHDAQFAVDGTLRSASFRRHDASVEFNLTYIYSPGGKPTEWTSTLGPVVLTRIGQTDWWLEQSPDD